MIATRELVAVMAFSFSSQRVFLNTLRPSRQAFRADRVRLAKPSLGTMLTIIQRIANAFLTVISAEN